MNHEDGTTSVPRFIIELNDPPKRRWDHIIDYYKQDLRSIRDTIINDILPPGSLAKMLSASVAQAAALLSKLGIVMYSKELKGISERSGLSLGELTLMQFGYEAASCCTSVAVSDENNGGKPVHIRTMDWGIEALGPLTCEVEFQRAGVTQFFTTTWPGYVGVLTGMRPNGYSTSVNFRVTSSGYWSNIVESISYSWPIGYLVRSVLESDTTFDVATTHLANSDLIAPVYFTCVGTEVNEAKLITRNRRSEEQQLCMECVGPIVQTNIDHWNRDPNDDILYSIERRDLAYHLLESRSSSPSGSYEDLWSILSVHPIRNSL